MLPTFKYFNSTNFKKAQWVFKHTEQVELVGGSDGGVEVELERMEG